MGTLDAAERGLLEQRHAVSPPRNGASLWTFLSLPLPISSLASAALVTRPIRARRSSGTGTGQKPMGCTMSAKDAGTRSANRHDKAIPSAHTPWTWPHDAECACLSCRITAGGHPAVLAAERARLSFWPSTTSTVADEPSVASWAAMGIACINGSGRRGTPRGFASCATIATALWDCTATVPMETRKEAYPEGFRVLVSATGTPLMPTTHRRANRLITRGRALRRFDRGLFYIKLLDWTDGYTQPMAIGIDPGSKPEALVVQSRAHTLLNVQTEAVTWVAQAVARRRRARRLRRSRTTPHRRCRCNRLAVQKRLPPSTRARWALKARLARWLARYYPVPTMLIEGI